MIPPSPAQDPFQPEMTLIPGGHFEMGDIFGEGPYSERPLQQVKLTDFYLSRYPVTQAQWVTLMGKNPCRDQSDPQLPVVEVTWHEIQVFLEKLNQLSGLSYRLPSEAEWEYAARERGQKIRFGNGKDLASAEEINFDAQLNDNQTFGFVSTGENRNKLSPVGSFAPNALGLYDLSGNVWEYCADVWHESYFGGPKDGSAWVEGGDQDLHIIRGGSWKTSAYHCRCTHRSRGLPEYRLDDRGFRVARTA